MKKKLLNTLLATAAVAALSVSGANAAILDNVAGNIQFQFTAFDGAQTSYDTTGLADGAVLCATTAACDAASIAAGGAAASFGASGTDDTYGVGRVNSIVSLPLFASQWSDGDNGDVLLAYFGGFTDEKVQRISSTRNDIFSTGGMVDIYRIDAATFAGINQANQTTIDADVAALSGSLYLGLTFTGGCSSVETAATLCGSFGLTTFTGNSSGNAIATSGSAMTKYPNEFFFEQSVIPCSTALCTGTSYNIFVRSGSASTIALPEPGTLGLLGLGLVGLGLVGRRRKVA